MQPVNYDSISTIYDDVRQAGLELIQHFVSRLELTSSKRILDLGCGTGNYLDMFQRMSQGQFYGVEPSEGMRLQASQKNSNVTIMSGNAYNIPFDDAFFDFIYMTDVIHHISDSRRMFDELSRVLKPNGRVCIVTQSHQQIEQRPIARFFPETIQVDQARYPKIDDIVQIATSFQLLTVTTLQEQVPTLLGMDFLELVRKKGYSMLHLISDSAYVRGLKQLELALQHGDIEATQAGSTLIWLQKP
jgi:ubiquinone/menaquinone biosynthesis C-methylase UbiE